jgi:hypothetical protein
MMYLIYLRIFNENFNSAAFIALKDRMMDNNEFDRMSKEGIMA